MKIQVNIKDDHPNHKLKSITLDSDSIQLLPQPGDYISDGSFTVLVDQRTFQYGKDEITITLNCH